MRRRRRRRGGDPTFGFDSFLDVVANVIGIVLRLILVVWVGARSYTAWQHLVPPPDVPTPEVAGPLPALPPDPLQDELARQRQELEQAQARLLEQLRQLQQCEGERTALDRELAEVAAVDRSEEAELPAPVDDSAVRVANLSVEEMRRRCQELSDQVRALDGVKMPTQTLRARTPVSRPAHAEEVFFECRAGRVTFIDLEPMLAEIRRGLQDKADQLRSRWEARAVTEPVGAFRLRYVVERERGPLEGGAPAPVTATGFSYGVSGWELEPLDPGRGETQEQALAAGSEYRRIVDNVDPRTTTVTFWVYPDSFALYRKLRDVLAERDVVVAGRPLPEGLPIASSRRGTTSRGQ